MPKTQKLKPKELVRKSKVIDQPSHFARDLLPPLKPWLRFSFALQVVDLPFFCSSVVDGKVEL